MQCQLEALAVVAAHECDFAGLVGIVEEQQVAARKAASDALEAADSGRAGDQPDDRCDDAVTPFSCALRNST